VPPPTSWRQQGPVAATHEYAGFWRRFLANGVDRIPLTMVQATTNGLIDVSLARAGNALPESILWWLAVAMVVLVMSFVIEWLYYALQESSTHQATIGKRALGIVVTDLAGNRISFGRATGRYFARYITFLTLGIGYLIQPFTAKRQALHDKIAGTLVIRS
jgi:uncharacterized RDD family membrane protein YckC